MGTLTFFMSLGQADPMPVFRRILMYLWEHKLWNHGVRIFVLSITMDIELDGTTDSRFLLFLKFLSNLCSVQGLSLNKSDAVYLQMTFAVAFPLEVEKHQRKLPLPLAKHNFKGCTVPNRIEVEEKQREGGGGEIK